MASGHDGRHAIERWWRDDRAAPPSARPLLALLAGASLAYRAGRALHRGVWSAGLRRRARLPVPVVSVGNVTVGGVGKTPFVAWLARAASARGLRVLVLGRGYGRPAGAPLNDEGAWLARALPQVRVVQAADRFRAAQEALAQAPADLVLLDDGFQHEPLARDLDVVLVDGCSPFGNGRLLPRGPLREPLAALRRADFVFVTRAELLTAAELAVLRSRLAALAPSARLGSVRFGIGALRRGTAREPVARLRGRAIVLCTGVGSPDSVAATAARLGATVADHLAFPDHHAFTRAELERALARAAELGAELVVTAKDAVKLDELGDAGRYLVLEQEADVADGGPELLRAAAFSPTASS